MKLLCYMYQLTLARWRDVTAHVEIRYIQFTPPLDTYNIDNSASNVERRSEEKITLQDV